MRCVWVRRWAGDPVHGNRCALYPSVTHLIPIRMAFDRVGRIAGAMARLKCVSCQWEKRTLGQLWEPIVMRGLGLVPRLQHVLHHCVLPHQLFDPQLHRVQSRRALLGYYHPIHGYQLLLLLQPADRGLVRRTWSAVEGEGQGMQVLMLVQVLVLVRVLVLVPVLPMTVLALVLELVLALVLVLMLMLMLVLAQVLALALLPDRQLDSLNVLELLELLFKRPQHTPHGSVGAARLRAAATAAAAAMYRRSDYSIGCTRVPEEQVLRVHAVVGGRYLHLAVVPWGEWPCFGIQKLQDPLLVSLRAILVGVFV